MALTGSVGKKEFVLFNENGGRAFASLEAGRLVAPTWQIVADVASDGKSIAWSNGTRWIR